MPRFNSWTCTCIVAMVAALVSATFTKVTGCDDKTWYLVYASVSIVGTIATMLEFPEDDPILTLLTQGALGGIIGGLFHLW